jgi:pimeloyl-ACP methyl ester carboxylesterase
VGVLLLAGSLVSCKTGGDGPEPKPLEPAESSTSGQDKALARYYDQAVEWSDCRETMQCAEVEVPLDYAHPDGEAITLSVLKVPAEDDDPIGALLVNPGGPGGSGVDYAAAADDYFGEALRSSYDIVGFDPRGVGTSTPIDCLSDADLDEFVASDPDPDTPQEARRSDELMRAFGQGCLELSGDLTRHVSTEEAARDIDVLRGVLGQDRLAYFGASYGTYLGATYADLFPQRVGRMVLDGAIDPTMDSIDTSLVQAEGFEVALRAYVEHCVDGGSCFLGDTVDGALGSIRDLLDRVDAQPLPGDGERMLTEGEAVLGIWAPLYNRDYWSALDAALKEALAGRGKVLLSFADAYVGRGPDGYADNSSEALYAVNCLDHDDSVTLEEAAGLEDQFLEASPTFGRVFAFGLTACRSWSVHTGKGPEELTAPGADPIMVVGTSRDPATPLSWAEALADQLESGVLVRRDGDGHTGYLAGNECVDDAVESYLVSGEVPDGTVDC